MMERTDFLKTIQSNIDRTGYHVTVVAGISLPRWAYTIGCKESFGFELIFAGGEFYSKDNVGTILNEMIQKLKKGEEWQSLSLNLKSLGSFSLSSVHKTWGEKLALGVYDFYNQSDIQTLQILPDKEHFTIDVPNMSGEFDVNNQSIWKWLVREWDYPIPRDSTVVTNLKVLFGEKATEVMRWEAKEWEIFAGKGPDVQKEDMRALPLAILLGIDNSLEPVIQLKVGKGLWRDTENLVWNPWG
jgi:hypothetical protein